MTYKPAKEVFAKLREFSMFDAENEQEVLDLMEQVEPVLRDVALKVLIKKGMTFEADKNHDLVKSVLTSFKGIDRTINFRRLVESGLTIDSEKGKEIYGLVMETFEDTPIPRPTIGLFFNAGLETEKVKELSARNKKFAGPLYT